MLGIASKIVTVLGHIRRRELAGVTRRLSPHTMMSGYRSGRFPWPKQSLPYVIPWFSPNPRSVVFPERVHVGKNVKRVARHERWTTTVNEAFDNVVDGCASRKTTWIDDEIREVYGQLHRRRSAYSVEVWDESDNLIGGLFGVQTGGVFGIESQFHFVDHASKAAFVELARRARLAGGVAIDCQFPTSHLYTLGAEDVPRDDFQALLLQVRDKTVPLPTTREPVTRLLEVHRVDPTAG